MIAALLIAAIMVVPPPAPPTNPKMRSMGCGQYDLSWTPMQRAEWYEVVRSQTDAYHGVFVDDTVGWKIDVTVPMQGFWTYYVRSCGGFPAQCSGYTKFPGVARYSPGGCWSA